MAIFPTVLLLQSIVMAKIQEELKQFCCGWVMSEKLFNTLKQKAMFTLDQIKASHTKVKSGADFPNYVQDLIELGVAFYETYVSDGHTDYLGKDGYKTSSEPTYSQLIIAGQGDADQFRLDLKAHQQGKTDYATFCSDCAKSGVEKWTVRMDKMTCTYYNKAGNELLAEAIPQ